jgi:uncharacterized protein YhjY with autotransporter beta-barrel domain
MIDNKNAKSLTHKTYASQQFTTRIKALAVGLNRLLDVRRHADWCPAIALIALQMVQPAMGQSLDEIQTNLLQTSCQALKGNSEQKQSEFFAYAGPQLSFLCDPATGGGVGGPGVASSSGGGAAGNQTSFVAIARRLAKAHGARDDKQIGGAAGDDITSNLGGGLNLFLSGQFEGLDRTTTRFETGYKSNVNGVTGGVDYRFADWLVSGIAVNYNHWDGNFDTAGGFKTDSLGPMFYASFLPMENMFADVMLEYTHQSRDRSRFSSFSDTARPNHKSSGIAAADYEANRFGANAVLGYDRSIGAFTIGPRFRFRYTDLNINNYTETGSTGLEMRFLRDRVTSLQTAIGLQASAAISTGIGVVVPQITADWTHEFQNNQHAMYAQFVQDGRPVPTTFQFQNDKPDRDFFHVGTGVGLVLAHGIQPYVNFEALLGNSMFNNFVGTVGIRLEL